MSSSLFVPGEVGAARAAPRRWWCLAPGAAVCAACTVTPLPGGVTDTPTATTATAVDSGDETLGTTSGLPLDSTIGSLASTDAATLLPRSPTGASISGLAPWKTA